MREASGGRGRRVLAGCGGVLLLVGVGTLGCAGACGTSFVRFAGAPLPVTVKTSERPTSATAAYLPENHLPGVTGAWFGVSPSRWTYTRELPVEPVRGGVSARVPGRYWSIRDERLHDLTLGPVSLVFVHHPATDALPEKVPTVFSGDNPVEFATIGEDGIARYHAPAAFLPTISVPPGATSLEVVVDPPVPTTRLRFRGFGWDEDRHAASGAQRAGAKVVVPAGTTFSLPYEVEGAGAEDVVPLVVPLDLSHRDHEVAWRLHTRPALADRRMLGELRRFHDQRVVLRTLTDGGRAVEVTLPPGESGTWVVALVSPGSTGAGGFEPLWLEVTAP